MAQAKDANLRRAMASSAAVARASRLLPDDLTTLLGAPLAALVEALAACAGVHPSMCVLPLLTMFAHCAGPSVRVSVSSWAPRGMRAVLRGAPLRHLSLGTF
jgi:hypothetical protein